MSARVVMRARVWSTVPTVHGRDSRCTLVGSQRGQQILGCVSGISGLSPSATSGQAPSPLARCPSAARSDSGSSFQPRTSRSIEGEEGLPRYFVLLDLSLGLSRFY